MRRPLWFRALIAVWGIWLTTAITERSRFFVCSMHGEGAAAGSAMSASMQGASTSTAGHPAEDTRRDRTDVCTCADECCGAAFIATPALSPELQIAAIVTAPVARYASVERVDLAPEHLLPFANAPPAPLAS